jgi:hypothetical protein
LFLFVYSSHDALHMYLGRERVQDPGSSIRGLKEGRVEASAFRTYYTPLNEQHVSAHPCLSS